MADKAVVGGGVLLGGVSSSGAYLGIAKAITGGELSVEGTAVPESRTFDVHPTDDGSLKLSISTGGGYWTFLFVHIPPAMELAGTWKLAPVEGAFKVGPNPDDGSWWQNSADDVTTRACLFDDGYVFVCSSLRFSDCLYFNGYGNWVWIFCILRCNNDGAHF